MTKVSQKQLSGDDRATPPERTMALDSRAAIAVGLFGLASVLPLFRQSGTDAWRSLWAEDGPVYFQQAYEHGGLAVLFRGYNGYLQLPPRLLGAVSPFVPVRDLAIFCAVSAQIVNGVLAVFVHWASGGWIRSRLVRVALASLVVLMPALGRENTATITNTIWAFAAVAPWALMATDDRKAAVVARSVVVFLAATATPLTAIYLPLSIGYALWRRTRATWTVVAAFVAGLALQALVVMNTSDVAPSLQRPREDKQVPDILSIRVFAQYLLGDRPIEALWGFRRLLVVAAPLIVLGVVVVLLRRAGPHERVLATTFIALAVVSFLLPVWKRGTDLVALTAAEKVEAPFPGTETAYVTSNRLSVVPVMLLGSALALLTAGLRPSQRTPNSVWAVAFTGHVVLVIIIGFHVTNVRSVSPGWDVAVDRAERLCSGSTTRDDQIQIVQDGFLAWFPVTVRCRDVR